MKLKSVGPVIYIAPGDPGEKAFLARSTFKRLPGLDVWATTHVEDAACLRPSLSPKAQAHLLQLRAASEIKGIRSRAKESDFYVPIPEGLALRPYQVAGVEWLYHNKNALLADPPGLGKTLQVIGLLNRLHFAKKILIVCPAIGKGNWQNEMEKWFLYPRRIGIVQGGKSWPEEADVIICNYDVLHAHNERLSRDKWDVAVLDESHNIKNPDTKRAMAVLGNKARKLYPIRAERKICLTGTPILSRPKELYSSLRWLDPIGWPTQRGYLAEFCGLWSSPWGAQANGATKTDKLQRLLRRGLMVRREKKDVLTDLPPKERQVILLDPVDGVDTSLTGKLRDVVERDGFEAGVRAISNAFDPEFAAMSAIRRDTAIAKIPFVISHLRELLDEVDKVVVFAHHKAVIAALAEAFPGPAVITGATPTRARTGIVKRFQEDPSCRVFLGNILAAGEVITLTAAATVLFAELDWRPGKVNQAEDRCWRIGQNEAVLVQHLIFRDSIDSFMINLILKKQGIIDKCLDVVEK